MPLAPPIPPPPSPAPPPWPVRWPREYRTLADSLGPQSPLRRMGEPHRGEERPDPGDLPDPTGEQGLRPLPFLVQKHPDRVVVLAAARCYFYCRFCFRRGQQGPRTEPTAGDWEAIGAWLTGHPKVREAVLSGGDPLTLPDRRLAWVGERLAAVSSLERWRLHSRAPVVLPARVTPRLVAALRSPLPLRVVVHANHPAEVRPAFREAVARLRDAGFQVLNQAVLLRGVNDDAATLLDLFRRLADAGVGAHYLHHPDRAPGNARFRVTVARGLALYRRVLRRGGAAAQGGVVPPYVLDLPNGAGKCPVAALRPVAREVTADGVRVRYRWERPAGWRALVAATEWEGWDVGG